MRSRNRDCLIWFAALACGGPALAQAPARKWLDVRMAAWHQTLVATDEQRPNSCLSTYIRDRFTQTEAYGLAKFMVMVEVDGKLIGPAEAKDIRVEDTPGGVVATYMLGPVKVTTELTALTIGREVEPTEGAAIFRATTDPPTPAVIRCGGSALISFQLSRSAWLRNDELATAGDTVRLAEGAGLLASKTHPLIVAILGSQSVVTAQETDRSHIELRLAQGTGHLLLSFAEKESRAVALARSLDAQAERRKVDDYYRKLLSSRIETPEKVIDEAFRTALITLEYNWLKPYGWVECIHHWVSLWHMQHSAAAEWIGQADRSRDCIMSHAANLMPDGAVPQLGPDGRVHRDFGGSNQFYAWQVRHYWGFTGDRDAARQLAPVLDRVIRQTYQESDPNNDRLLAWGQQIGNQEDYVSTPFNGTSPTIEGVQMLRTRAALAVALGDDEANRRCEREISGAINALRQDLWQPDLGMFAFFRDPLGVVRPDGQYHTLIYPLIWDVADPVDAWPGIRHLRDRLTGDGGEVYCSNNFPNHVGGTWGMQAGAAQQPWAAWGLARMGLRNETYRPLKALAGWVAAPDIRGAWPEVSTEPTPAYFSPPAGLYIQAVIEALFGLELNKPEGTLTIAPSFPDSWPSARLSLPGFRAEYKRRGQTLEYTVDSDAAFKRHVRWLLPPGELKECLINGKPAECRLSPWVNSMLLSTDVDAEKRTHIVIRLEPLDYRVEHPASVAEGDSFSIKAVNCGITRIEDRCGILATTAARSSSDWEVVVRRGLLQPYLPFGRLGQLNFSRRSVLLSCEGENGLRFLVPVDLTILPPVEATVREKVAANDQGASIRIQIRNNTRNPLKGGATLEIAQTHVPFDVDIEPHGEAEHKVRLPATFLGLMCPGENQATLILPGEHCLQVVFVASDAFASLPSLMEHARTRLVHVPLPESALVADDTWRKTRAFYAYGHMPWNGSKAPLADVAVDRELTLPALPGVSFKPSGRRFVPISWRTRPSWSLDLGGELYRKFYLLVIPFLDNHDTFSPVAQVTVEGSAGIALSRRLHFPGDLDWWCPQEVVGDFATAAKPRSDRFGLLPMLPAGVADWREGRPPAFPQPQFWATCLPLKTPSSVMNVIELDLGRPTQVRSLHLAAIGVDPAIGLVAISAEKASGHTSLHGTPYLPPVELREPSLLFQLTTPGNFEGWTTQGDAFSVAPVPGLFTEPTLNSLARAGEQATGKAMSPAFQTDGWAFIQLHIHGGTPQSDQGLGALCVRLVDVETGKELHRLAPSGTHVPQVARIPLTSWQGRQVRIELIDQNTASSYAWIGVSDVRLTAR